MNKTNFLTSTKKYLPNEAIINLGNKTTLKENPGRIQVDEEKFILPPQNIYHSCKPSAFVDWTTMELKAFEIIPKGTLVTYHYGTSEDDYSIGMFQCNCKSSGCVRFFKGCKYLTETQRDKIKDLLSPFLKRKYYKTKF